jgi:N utilization substance protein B
MLCEKDVPVGAAINEAVELAKEYGADESPAFINGVLGGISRQLKDHKNE